MQKQDTKEVEMAKNTTTSSVTVDLSSFIPKDDKESRLRSELNINDLKEPILGVDPALLEKKENIYVEDPSCITDKLDHGVHINDIIIKPNIEDDDIPSTIMKIVNVKGLSASRSALGTTIIEPGKIGIIMHSGKVEVAGPGR